MDKQISATLDAMAASVKPERAPILKTPADYGLEFQDVFFPSFDGVPLEAWFIPADSDKLIICNHPMTMNRYGFPGHLEPWKSFSNVPVDFNKVYKALHQAGCDVNEALHLSPNYLGDLLKQETGKSAIEHIHHYLIEKAKSLLVNTSDSISQIAYALGFEQPQNFSKLFKKKLKSVLPNIAI